VKWHTQIGRRGEKAGRPLSAEREVGVGFLDDLDDLFRVVGDPEQGKLVVRSEEIL